MQKIIVPAAAFFILFSAFPPVCGAEKIYYKDGKVVNGTVTSRGKGTIWVEIGKGMSTGISTKKIKKIENDDGSISKYDYETLEKTILQDIKNAQYPEAAMLCGVFLETVPNYTRMRYLRSILNHRIGNLKEAAEDYDYLISNKAADSRIYNNRGIISACNKDYLTAIHFFSTAINRNPEMIEARNNLANAYMGKKEYKKAIIEYKKVLIQEPKNIKVLYNLGTAYNNSGDRKKAEKQWKKVMCIDPENEEAKKALKTK